MVEWPIFLPLVDRKSNLKGLFLGGLFVSLVKVVRGSDLLRKHHVLLLVRFLGKHTANSAKVFA